MVMQIVAWVASLFVFLSFFMKTMIPLRVIAIVSNLTFITYSLLGLQYGIFEKVYPIFVLHSLLLPLNIVRLYQMKNLIKKVHEATESDTINYLIPYMQSEAYKKGEILFEKGDKAEKLYFLQKGEVTLPEVNKTVSQGEVFGEVGMFSPDNMRAASAVCSNDCKIFSISRDKVLELYYQNPKFGFFLIRMISGIVLETSLQYKKVSIEDMKSIAMHENES